MGYTTDFSGCFMLDKPLNTDQIRYLDRFANTRRMTRNTALLPRDPFAIAVGLPHGEEGQYYVASKAQMGQDDDASVIKGNVPPVGQPGLWCQWVPTDDGMSIEWDGGEKFYNYVDWIKYLIQHFIAPWGFTLNGNVTWHGEDPFDSGVIVVNNNIVTTKVN